MTPRRSKLGATYPDDWTEIVAKLKDEHDWKCERCKHPHERESGHVLTVHHLDLDPGNCAWWNLAVLCQKCHLSIQAKVVMEQEWLYDHSEWFRLHVAGYHAHLRGRPDDKEYVTGNLDELLQPEVSP